MAMPRGWNQLFVSLFSHSAELNHATILRNGATFHGQEIGNQEVVGCLYQTLLTMGHILSLSSGHNRQHNVAPTANPPLLF